MMNYERTSNIAVGYDLDKWNDYNEKTTIHMNISSTTNSHMLICGMSGSGKSYYQTQIMARLIKASPQGEFYFADYKAEDAYAHLKDTQRYYVYKNTLDALETVYLRLNQRLSGEDKTQHQITLIWDEYVANILAIISEDKKKASIVMNKVSEILMMGRSKGVRIIVSCQRPDAIAFPVGSRLNYGIIVVLGGYVKSVYEMLMPDHIDKIKNKEFGRGEGTILFQNAQLHFIKVPKVNNEDEMKEVCKRALVNEENKNGK